MGTFDRMMLLFSTWLVVLFIENEYFIIGWIILSFSVWVILVSKKFPVDRLKVRED